MYKISKFAALLTKKKIILFDSVLSFSLKINYKVYMLVCYE